MHGNLGSGAVCKCGQNTLLRDAGTLVVQYSRGGAPNFSFEARDTEGPKPAMMEAGEQSTQTGALAAWTKSSLFGASDKYTLAVTGKMMIEQERVPRARLAAPFPSPSLQLNPAPGPLPAASVQLGAGHTNRTACSCSWIHSPPDRGLRTGALTHPGIIQQQTNGKR